MEATCFFETSGFLQTTPSYNPEDCAILHLSFSFDLEMIRRLEAYPHLG
jgi:hypothetical protein